MPKMVTLTIDGHDVTVPEGTLIVDAARQIGIDIPVFCYHPKMEPVGMCRMCLVDIGRPVIDRGTGQPVLDEHGKPKVQFAPKLDTACTTPVSQGMVVVQDSEKVRIARKDVVEFILTSHPLDCPVCDKGGECPLQNLTMGYGPGQSRFEYSDKQHFEKLVALGELIWLDRERCIQCGRCVRFQSEIAGDPVIGFYQRGRSLEIITDSEPGFDSVFSGNTTDICPVGALTTADFRFGARPWEMKAAASICSHCPVGCNITYNVRREAHSKGQMVIKRVMPRQNEAVNEIWMCDKGRFAFHFAESDQRLKYPLVRKGCELVQATWEEALNRVAEQFQAEGSGLVTLVGGRLANEDLFNIYQLGTAYGGQTLLHTTLGGGDLTAQVGVGQGTNFAHLGKGSAVLVVASDLEEEAPLWALRLRQAAKRGATVIVANPRPTKLDRSAAYSIRYRYGQEVETVHGLLPGTAGASPAAQAFANAEKAIVFFGSEGLGLEQSQALAQACAELLLATGHAGKPDNGLIGVWPAANTQGAWDIGFRPAVDLAERLAGAKAAWIAAADPAGDDLALATALDQAGFVVVQELFLTETAKRADVVLPAQAYTEREGTFTSGERRVQRFYPVIPPLPGPRADFSIAADLAGRLAVNLEGRFSSLVFPQLVAQVAGYTGLSYQKLSAVEPQLPIVGQKDLYYGGTTYANGQGLGVQLVPTSQQGGAIHLEPPLNAFPSFPEGSLLAAPVTVLYDRSVMVTTSPLLSGRLAPAALRLNPQDAAGLGVAQGDMLIVTSAAYEFTAPVELDGDVPAGIILAPRSTGLPVRALTPVKVTASAATSLPIVE